MGCCPQQVGVAAAGELSDCGIRVALRPGLADQAGGGRHIPLQHGVPGDAGCSPRCSADTWRVQVGCNRECDGAHPDPCVSSACGRCCTGAFVGGWPAVFAQWWDRVSCPPQVQPLVCLLAESLRLQFPSASFSTITLNRGVRCAAACGRGQFWDAATLARWVSSPVACCGLKTQMAAKNRSYQPCLVV